MYEEFQDAWLVILLMKTESFYCLKHNLLLSGLLNLWADCFIDNIETKWVQNRDCLNDLITFA